MTEPFDGGGTSQVERFRRMKGVNFHNPQSSWSRAVEGWFLGPKAENADEFERLLLEAFRDHVFWRRNFHPADPTHITEEMKRSPEYLRSIDSLRENFRTLLTLLKKSVPFFSLRYQGHMLWEQTMPATLGYFATLLYNPNNVSFEASTATTLLEILVGTELCTMLGFETGETAETPAWGHITCGGTVANIEALWAARNLKYLPLTLQAAIRNEDALAGARDISVPLPSGDSVLLRDATTWQALNLRVDDVLALPTRLSAEYEVDRDELTEAMNKYSVQSLGMHAFTQQLIPDLAAPPAFLVTGTKHYSWPKGAAVLGIGQANMLNIPVDVDGRMDVRALESMLDECLRNRRPVYEVVAVVGSTEEGAVDPLSDVLALRERFHERGLAFPIHADGAWGGYFTSMIRADTDPMARADQRLHRLPILNSYLHTQLEAVSKVDSVTLDPHKSGYIPYPAGALCYRNSAMRDLLTFSAPVMFHGGAEPTVGIYGLEGSKSGAPPAAAYLSLQVIRPTESGHGRLLGQAMFCAKRLYAALRTMFGPGDPFIVVPLARLPAEIAGQGVDEQVEEVRRLICDRTNEEIIADPEAMKLLREIGPDLNIVSYAFNFRLPDGRLNTDLDLTNQLNRRIYDRLSIDPDEDIYGYELIVSTTEVAAADYGTRFVEDYKARLGTSASPGTTIQILRSVVMDPWVSDTSHGAFLDTLEDVLRRTATLALGDVAAAHEGVTTQVLTPAE